MVKIEAARDSPQSTIVSERLSEVTTRFWNTLEAIWDLLSIITPHVQQLDEERREARFYEITDSRIRHLPASKRRTVANHLRKVAGMVSDAASAAEAEKSADDAAEDRAVLYSAEAKISPEAESLVMELLLHIKTPPKLPIVMASLLPTAVGAFEVLVGELIRAFFKERSGLLGTAEKEFSLDDLRKFSSVEEAFDEAADRRVDTILAGGLDEWSRWLKKKGIDIEVERLSPNWSQTMEVFQRRHIVVHNAGRVSKRYRSRLEDLIDDLPSLDRELSVDESYLRGAIDNLLVLGEELSATVQFNLFGDRANQIVANQLRHVSERLLLDQRWHPLANLCELSQTHRRLPQALLLDLSCYGWLARKNVEGLETVRSEVAAWDASVLGLRLQVMKAALLDDEQLIPLIRRALASKDIDRVELGRSPFYADVREQLYEKRVIRQQSPAVAYQKVD